MKKLVIWLVFINNEPKGEVFKNNKRWIWFRPNGSKETYGPKSTIADVRDHIARLNNVWSNVVEFRKENVS